MAANTYLDVVNGVPTVKTASQASAGVGDAGKVPALDSTGRLDQSMMPNGVAADTAVLPASEALTAGDLVNVWSNAGVASVRKADGSTSGKEAHGYVLSAVTSGSSATVYFEGTDSQATGLTPGRQYLSATPGKSTATPLTGSGQTVQIVGFGTSTTALNFQSGQPFVLA